MQNNTISGNLRENGDYVFKPAVYRTETGRYAGHPFVEALPPLPDNRAAWKALRSLPPQRDAEFFAKPLHHRIEALHDIDDIFVPSNDHADELQAIMGLIRRGLLYRNPMDPRVMAHIYRCAMCSEHDWRSGAATRLLQSTSPSGGSAMGRMIFGPTGSGKSTLMRRTVNYIDKTPIEHTSINGRSLRTIQLPVIYAECEDGFDLKAMVRKVLEHFDAALGTDYARLGRRSPTPLWSQLSQLYRAATTNHLGLLILDDLQRLKALDAKTEITLQAFSTFMQATGIPILSVATNGVQKLLVSHMQEGRKLMAKGHRELTLPQANKEFGELCSIMWKYRVSHPGLPMPTFFPEQVFHYTQGFFHAFNLLIPAIFEDMAEQQHSPLNTHPDKPLTPDMIKACAERVLPGYEGSLDVLRLVAYGEIPKPEQYAAFEHLLPFRRDVMQTFEEAKTEAELRKKEEEEEVKRKEAVAGAEQRAAEKAAAQANTAESGNAKETKSKKPSTGKKPARKKSPKKVAPALSHADAVQQGHIQHDLDD
jgi:hypothetical protein